MPAHLCKSVSLNLFSNSKMIFWHFLFFIFFAAHQIESGKIRPNFDEIFGNGWDPKEREDKVIIKIGQKVQNKQIHNSATFDQIGGEMGNDPIDQQKTEIILKFDAIKEKLKEKRKLTGNEKSKIECKIGKLLGESRHKIFKWKKELNLKKTKMLEKSFYEGKKKEFIERIDEFKSLYGQRKQKEFVKELGISEETFRKWKKELLPKCHKPKSKYSNEKKLEKMKRYFKSKGKILKLATKESPLN